MCCLRAAAVTCVILAMTSVICGSTANAEPARDRCALPAARADFASAPPDRVALDPRKKIEHFGCRANQATEALGPGKGDAGLQLWNKPKALRGKPDRARPHQVRLADLYLVTGTVRDEGAVARAPILELHAFRRGP